MPTSSHPTRTLLREIEAAVEELQPFPALGGADYMRAHVAFEAASDQQSRIRRWLEEQLVPRAPGGLAVASVGAGSGILDIPLIERVARAGPLTYRVFEPEPAHCEAFTARAREELAELDGLELAIECAPVERVDPQASFDVVLAIHSTYYFDDLEASLERLLGMLRPGGRLILGVAPCEAMNQLAEFFWRSQSAGPLHFEAEVLATLDRLGATYDVERLDADLVLDAADDAASEVASFLIHTPIDDLDEAVRDGVLAYLREAATERSEGRLSIPHPVAMISARP